MAPKFVMHESPPTKRGAGELGSPADGPNQSEISLVAAICTKAERGDKLGLVLHSESATGVPEVAEVLPSSPLARQLQPGDLLLAVNATPLVGASHATAVLEASIGQMVCVACRGAAASQARLVTYQKSVVGQRAGLELRGDASAPATVGEVRPSSTLTTQLRPGDVLVGVNGVVPCGCLRAAAAIRDAPTGAVFLHVLSPPSSAPPGFSHPCHVALQPALRTALGLLVEEREGEGHGGGGATARMV